MNSRLILLIPTLSSCLVAVQAQTTLSNGHVDLGILYEDGAWDLHVHKAFPEPEQEFAPDEAILQIGANAQLPGGVPDTAAATGYFGAAGSPLWILPKTEDPDLPFLGIGAEEMSAGDWTSPLAITLQGVSGPGDVFVWDVGAFGELEPRMSSRDGITSTDAVTVEPGSHGHYFWAFSAPGDYVVSVAASGTHAVDGFLESEPAGFRFRVVPEPGMGALLALGMVCLGWVRRRDYPWK